MKPSKNTLVKVIINREIMKPFSFILAFAYQQETVDILYTTSSCCCIFRDSEGLPE